MAPPQPSWQPHQLPDPFASNEAMVEVSADMLDPLAMPDPSLIENPLDVQIKTEVIDDEPIAMEGAMITDDPFGHPDEGDVSNLMISSVAGNFDHDAAGLETDIEIEPSNLGSPEPPNSTSSLEIEHNPIPDTDLDGSNLDPFEQSETILDDTPETDMDISRNNTVTNDNHDSFVPKNPPRIDASWINETPDASWINSPVNPEPEVENGQPEVEEENCAPTPVDNEQQKENNIGSEAEDTNGNL